MRKRIFIYCLLVFKLGAGFLGASPCGPAAKFDPTGVSSIMVSGRAVIKGFSQYTEVPDGELPTLYRIQSWKGINWFTSFCRWEIGEGSIYSGMNRINQEGELILGKAIKSFEQGYCEAGNPVETEEFSELNNSFYTPDYADVHPAWCYRDKFTTIISKNTYQANASYLDGGPGNYCGSAYYERYGSLFVDIEETMSNPESVHDVLLSSVNEPVVRQVPLGAFDREAASYKTSLDVEETYLHTRGSFLEIPVKANSVQFEISFEGLCPGDYYADFQLNSQQVTSDTDEPPAPVEYYRTDVIRFSVKQSDDGYKEISYDVPLVEGRHVWLANLPQAISATRCSDELAASSSELGSVSWSVSLGRVGYEQSAGNIWLMSEEINANLFTPAALSLDSDVKERCEVIYDDSTGVVRQVMSAEVLVDVVVISSDIYEIRLYPSDGLKRGYRTNYYDTSSAEELVVYRFERIGTGMDTLRISETRGGDTSFEEFYNDAGADLWRHKRGSGLVIEELAVSHSAGIIAKTRTLTDGSGKTASKVLERFKPIAGLNQRFERVEDPDGDALTTRWIYYDDPKNDGESYGRLRTKIDPTGYWETYSYDSETRRIGKTVSQYLDAPPGSPESQCQVERVLWSEIPDMDGDQVPESLKTVVMKVMGKETSRVHTIDFSALVENVRREYEPAPFAERFLGGNVNDVGQEYYTTEKVYRSSFRDRWIIEAIAEGAEWNDSSNTRVTKQRFYESGPFEGRLRYVLGSDGLLVSYDYRETNDGGTMVTTHKGIPEGPELSRVSRGTKIRENYNAVGSLVSREVIDVETSIVVEYQHATTFDEQGRVTGYAYSDGTTTRSNYNCCGLADETDIYGNTTSYFYDDLGRVDSEVRLGITTDYTYDAAGRIVEKAVIGTDNTSEIIQEQRFYTPSGELDYKLDAMSRTTDYERMENGAGQTVRTTINPDGGNVKKIYHQDGRLKSVDGSAAYPKQYEYGVVFDTHNNRSFNATFVKEILLGDNGGEEEFTATYYDMLGRVYKIEYPKLTSEGSVFAYKYYDKKGRLVREVEPGDGTSTLYEYDALGRTITTALDVDADQQIDYAGADQITRTAESYFEDPVKGFVRRSTVELWEIDDLDQPTVIQTKDVALSSQDVWTSIYGQNSHQSLKISGSGTYSQVRTAQDGTVNNTTYVDGYRKELKVSHPETGSLEQKKYNYDVFGRLDSVDDVRNGVTDYDYYPDGRIQSVTRPDPDTSKEGIGYDPQTTEYVYRINLEDGRLISVTLPDASRQHSAFGPRGGLMKRWGSKTYPVEYTYDHAGRKESMTTWQNFDEEKGVGINGSATTQWIYNRRGLLKEKRYDVIDTSTYTPGPRYAYDDTGRLHTRTSARSLVTTYRYHRGTGRLQKVVYSDATSGVTNTYTRAGRLKTVQDESGIRQLQYDTGRLTSVEWGSGALAGFRVERGYDEYLRPNFLRLSQEEREVYNVNYGYYPDSRLRQVSHGHSLFEYGYHPESQLLNRTTSRYRGQIGLQVEREWDRLNRLASIETAFGYSKVPLQAFDYIYNDLNQREQVRTLGSKYWEYGYDDMGQVKSANKRRDSDGASLPGYGSHYAYDDIGNRRTSGPRTASEPGYSEYFSGSDATGDQGANALNQYGGRRLSRSVQVIGEADASASVTVNDGPATRVDEVFGAIIDYSTEDAPDEARYETLTTVAKLSEAGEDGADLVSVKDGRAYLAPNPENFVYDADGNLIEDGRWKYTWNAENRLVAMETLAVAYNVGAPRQKLEFAYDSRGRRFSKKVYEWDTLSSSFQLSSSTRYLYNGWNLIAEIDAMAPSSPAIRSTYVWGLDLSGTTQGAGGVGGLLAVNNQNGSTYYPAFDGNGNVMAYYAADTGESVAEFEYGPFGEPLRETGPNAEAFNFRFSTKYQDLETELLYYGFRYYDPVTGRWPSRDPIGERGGLNLYGMVGNDPVNIFDILGLQGSRSSRSGYTPDGGPWLTREYWTMRFDTSQNPTLSRPGLFGLKRRVADYRTSDYVVPETANFTISISTGPNRTPGSDFGKVNTLDIPTGTKTFPVTPNADRIPNPDKVPDGVYPCLIRVKCNQKCKCGNDSKTVSWTPRDGVFASFIPGTLYQTNPYSTLPANTGWECRPDSGFEESSWSGSLAQSFCGDGKKKCSSAK
ncbi:RHS repeat-associated core domain-containing protein [Coraliomargarita sinensis]|nr:RHS repeat-associated core domain-containing protein [Coraliomargarita sinensis]